MCGRYRLTKRRMLEIEEYYDIDSINELDLWGREFNIPPTESSGRVDDPAFANRIEADHVSLLKS